MHTSTRLQAGDFGFWRQSPNGEQAVAFDAFCPAYHYQDRVGVVSPTLEDGVVHTSYALLALTTAFYDWMRTHHDNFFDYPQHFAFVGADGSAGVWVGGELLPVDTPKLWNAWSWLDVWPDAKWVATPANAPAMLQRVLDYQINRLFWPRALGPAAFHTSRPLPAHLWKMLRTSVKSVYLYGEGDAAWAGLVGERIEIRVQPAAQTLVRESVEQLPSALLAAASSANTPALAAPQWYERVNVHEFLALLQGETTHAPILED